MKFTKYFGNAIMDSLNQHEPLKANPQPWFTDEGVAIYDW